MRAAETIGWTSANHVRKSSHQVAAAKHGKAKIALDRPAYEFASVSCQVNWAGTTPHNQRMLFGDCHLD
jgi:hypothetical protein